jgi:hypothetical protein
MPQKSAVRLTLLALMVLFSACAHQPTPYDYSAFHRAQPQSILILPPTNRSPDVRASDSILATASYPVAEAGYYVFPAALVAQMFQENGLTSPAEIQQLPPLAKLHEIFGADAALYIDIRAYGASYQILASDLRVSLDARLVDLRSGELLWRGSATASNQEGRGSNQGGIVGLLVSALVEQVANNLIDNGFKVGAMANGRLLTANPTGGLLYGPRSTQYVSP